MRYLMAFMLMLLPFFGMTQNKEIDLMADSVNQELDEAGKSLQKFAKTQNTADGLLIAGVTINTLGILISDSSSGLQTASLTLGGILSLSGIIVRLANDSHIEDAGTKLRNIKLE